MTKKNDKFSLKDMGLDEEIYRVARKRTMDIQAEFTKFLMPYLENDGLEMVFNSVVIIASKLIVGLVDDKKDLDDMNLKVFESIKVNSAAYLERKIDFENEEELENDEDI